MTIGQAIRNTTLRDVFLALQIRARKEASGLTGRHSEHPRRLPGFDAEYDQYFTRLPEYDAARSALSSHMALKPLVGAQEIALLPLHFVYVAFTRVPPPHPMPGADFDSLWRMFEAEIAADTSTAVLSAHLRNFQAPQRDFRLTETLHILETHGATQNILGAVSGPLTKDLHGGGGATHVIVATKAFRKSPDLFAPMASTSELMDQVSSALCALRLCGAGDVRVGRQFWHQASIFPFNSEGTTMYGRSEWLPGTNYILDESRLAMAQGVLPYVSRPVECKLSKRIRIALRAFDSIYQRPPAEAEDRILDSVTAIEALVGSVQESTFRVAFRVASILADGDDERVSLYERMLAFYDARSLISHGAELKPKHRLTIADEPFLRDIARRLIRAFISVTYSEEYSAILSKDSWESDLNKTLLHEQRKSDLRTAMGLGAA